MPSKIAPKLWVDWAGSGTIPTELRLPRFLAASALSAASDVTRFIRYQAGFRTRVGRDQLVQLSPLAAGFIEGLLDNRSLIFSEDDVTSPLYGLVLPNRLASLQVFYATNGLTYDLSQAYLRGSDDQPLIEQQSFPLIAYDALARFNESDVETEMYTDIRSDVAIGHVLDALGWPASKRILDTGAATFARWAATGVKGLEAIRQIVLSEGPPAIAYIDGDNNFVYEGRHYRLLTSRCTTSQATFRDSGTEPCYTRYNPRRPLENIVNQVTVQVKSWTSTGSVAMVVGGPALPYALPAGGSVQYVITPDSQYSLFSALVASITYSTGTGTTSFDRTSGGRAVLTISSVAGATISAVGVTGTGWAETAVDVSNSVDASASIALYGPRPLPHDFKPIWIGTQGEAVTYADYVVSRYQDRVPINTVDLDTLYDARTLQALERRISDRVTLVESRTGGSAEYFIEQIERRFAPGPTMTAALGCEKASSQTYWTLGVAGASELGVTTKLAY